MHSIKRRYKICICSVIQEELESFRKSKLQKIAGNLLDKLRKFYINGPLEIFSRLQVMENYIHYLLFAFSLFLLSLNLN